MFGLARTERPAIVDGATGEVTSYATLLADADDIAGIIGDRRSLVVVACRNDRFTVTAYATALTAGHPVLLLDGSRPVDVLIEVLTEYRATWLAAPAGASDVLDTVGLTPLEVHRRLGGELIRLPGPPPDLHPELALLLSTSGTTGSRKLVRLSRRNLESNADAIVTMLRLTPAERPISSLPLHYTFGLSVLHSHWQAGAAIVLTSESVMQRSFWDVVRDQHCTSLAGVPYTFQMLERMGFRDMSLPTLLTLQQAGGALSPELARTYGLHMADRGGRLHVMYGQTEATARMAWLPPDRLTEKLGSAGRAIPGGTLSIDTPSVDPVSGAMTGEVIYEGPNVMMGYATEAADLSLGDVQGGRLRTGDIGWLDDEGFLFISGRSKRIAKVFGLRVNLDEVELVLRASGPAAVVAGDDVLWAFCAFGTDDDVGALAAALSKRFRIHRSALRLRRVEAIPVMDSGKVDYQEVQRWIQG